MQNKSRFSKADVQSLTVGALLATLVMAAGYLLARHFGPIAPGAVAAMIAGIPICTALNWWAASPLRDMPVMPAWQTRATAPQPAVQRLTIRPVPVAQRPVTDQHGKRVCCNRCP